MSLCDIFPDDPSCAIEVDPIPVDDEVEDPDSNNEIEEEVIDDGEVDGVKDDDEGKAVEE